MKIIELKETVTASNDRDAEALRAELKEKGTLLINLMASPGAGKTTLLERTIADLKDRLRIAVMEADVDSDVAARRAARAGARAIQDRSKTLPGMRREHCRSQPLHRMRSLHDALQVRRDSAVA